MRRLNASRYVRARRLRTTVVVVVVVALLLANGVLCALTTSPAEPTVGLVTCGWFADIEGSQRDESREVYCGNACEARTSARCPDAASGSLVQRMVDWMANAALGLEEASQVRWGLPVSGGAGAFKRKSGFAFQGRSKQSVRPGAPFIVGILSHHNFAVRGFVRSVQLHVELLFTRSRELRRYSVRLVIDETPNDGLCKYESQTPCADRVFSSLIDASFKQAVSSSAVNYHGESRPTADDPLLFRLVGFASLASTNASAASGAFISQESSTHDMLVYGQLDFFSTLSHVQ